jgi:MarR family 2-MHQ and catechol resistance regulon transcriptional repressor
MMVSGGNVTNIVKQLEKEGLVNRTPQEKDNRSFIVTLSSKGEQTFEKMMPAHESWIVSIMDGLDTDEVQPLMESLDRIKAHIKLRS